ncbi:MAG TPA: hypothetical protein VJT67_04170 [Longimicrobiaceae bacterium]|nr:hypothetical protein [Longimicrobiaceae bacterium]
MTPNRKTVPEDPGDQSRTDGPTFTPPPPPPPPPPLDFPPDLGVQRLNPPFEPPFLAMLGARLATTRANAVLVQRQPVNTVVSIGDPPSPLLRRLQEHQETARLSAAFLVSDVVEALLEKVLELGEFARSVDTFVNVAAPLLPRLVAADAGGGDQRRVLEFLSRLQAEALMRRSEIFPTTDGIMEMAERNRQRDADNLFADVAAATGRIGGDPTEIRQVQRELDEIRLRVRVEIFNLLQSVLSSPSGKARVVVGGLATSGISTLVELFGLGVEVTNVPGLVGAAEKLVFDNRQLADRFLVLLRLFRPLAVVRVVDGQVDSLNSSVMDADPFLEDLARVWDDVQDGLKRVREDIFLLEGERGRGLANDFREAQQSWRVVQAFTTALPRRLRELSPQNVDRILPPDTDGGPRRGRRRRLQN